MTPGRLLLAALLTISVVSISIPGIDLLVRAREQDRTSGEWIGALGLSIPAFWPAGSLQRLGWNSTPAVDLRPAAFIPARAWDLFRPPAVEEQKEASCND